MQAQIDQCVDPSKPGKLYIQGRSYKDGKWTLIIQCHEEKQPLLFWNHAAGTHMQVSKFQGMNKLILIGNDKAKKKKKKIVLKK